MVKSGKHLGRVGRKRGQKAWASGSPLPYTPIVKPSKPPVHNTVTFRVGKDRTRHQCPECSYVAFIDWSAFPFTRVVAMTSDDPHLAICHVDRQTVTVGESA